MFKRSELFFKLLNFTDDHADTFCLEDDLLMVLVDSDTKKNLIFLKKLKSNTEFVRVLRLLIIFYLNLVTQFNLSLNIFVFYFEISAIILKAIINKYQYKIPFSI